MTKLLTLFTVLLLSSCSTLIDAGVKRFSVGLEPSSLTLAPGESGVTRVSIRPLTGVELDPGEATVTLYEPPEGVSAEPLSVPGNLDGSLTLRVAPDAALTPPDEPLELTVRAVKNGVGAEATLLLSISASGTS